MFTWEDNELKLRSTLNQFDCLSRSKNRDVNEFNWLSFPHAPNQLSPSTSRHMEYYIVNPKAESTYSSHTRGSFLIPYNFNVTQSYLLPYALSNVVSQRKESKARKVINKLFLVKGISRKIEARVSWGIHNGAQLLFIYNTQYSY